MPEHFDAIVIGGGFYGCAIALSLARRFERVVVLEREQELLTRASFINQARVHTGYHYPRSLQTAASSAKNLVLFRKIYGECIDSSFSALYAIARAGSKVNRRYFERFCRQLRLPLKPAPKSLTRLFSPRLIDGVYQCEEYAFNAAALRELLAQRLGAAGVEVRTGSSVESTACENGITRVSCGERTATAHWVFNTTYANLTRIRGLDSEQKVGLRHQVTEVCLIEPPEALAQLGITVMDGPFFSSMPFPARKLHSLTHVRYTPHFTWHEVDCPELEPDAMLALHKKQSRVEWMRRDSSRYVPVLAQAQYRDHYFEIKTTLTATVVDDARPIAFHRDRLNPRFVSVLGGKIDNIFDVLAIVDETLGPGPG